MEMGKSGLWNSSSRLSSSSCCRPMGELAIDQWEAGTHSRGQPTASNSQLCKRPRMESQSKIASQWSNLFTSFLRQPPSNNFPDALEGKNSKERVWTNKSRVGNPVNRKLLWNILIAHIGPMSHVNKKEPFDQNSTTNKTHIKSLLHTKFWKICQYWF